MNDKLVDKYHKYYCCKQMTTILFFVRSQPIGSNPTHVNAAKQPNQCATLSLYAKMFFFLCLMR